MPDVLRRRAAPSTERREAMAGQSTCTPRIRRSAHEVGARLARCASSSSRAPTARACSSSTTRKGRLQRTKRRDDCNAGSSGDKQEFVYDAEGLVTEIQTYDASNTLTAKQPFSYFDSRRLEKVINPVNASTWTGVTYDARGLVNQVDAAGGLGKTVFHRDRHARRRGARHLASTSTRPARRSTPGA